MALISNAALQAILDKLARYATEAVGDPEFANDFNSGLALAADDVLSGAGGIGTYVLATADIDVVADLLPAARDLDEDHPTPPDGFLLGIPKISAFITALSAHLKRYGDATGLDGYLTTLNSSTPTLRAHGHFKKYLKTLSAKNVFIPNDIVLAQITATAATTGTFLSVASISTTAYGGAKLVEKNQGAATGTTGITVTGRKFDGTTSALTASVSGADNAETNLSVTTKLFYAVTAIAITGATAGNVFEVVAKTDRDISAA